MSNTFGKLVLPSLFVSGAVFAVLAAPLAIYGSEKVDARISESIGISGATFQDLTVPYLGLSGLASLTLGTATAATIGVAASKKQAQTAEKRNLDAQVNFQNRERQLQDALLSESSLENSGLRFFLDEQMSSIQAVHPEVAIACSVQVPHSPVVHLQTAEASTVASFAPAAIVPVPVIAPQPVVSPQPVVTPQPMVVASSPIAQGFIVMNSSNLAVQPVKVPRATAQTATSPMNAAHGFLSFARLGQVVPAAAIAWAEETTERQTATQQVDVLQGQLQGLIVQIEQLQMSLKAQPVAEPTSRIEVIEGDRSLVAAAPHRFQPFEHSWASVPQRVAS